MAIDHVFRSTPQLGPALIDSAVSFWFLPPGTYDKDGSTPVDDAPGVSYQIGNAEKGTDGHDYMMVKNDTGGALNAEARFNVADDGTFALTASGSGSWMVPKDIQGGSVPSGAYFHARRYSL